MTMFLKNLLDIQFELSGLLSKLLNFWLSMRAKPIAFKKHTCSSFANSLGPDFTYLLVVFIRLSAVSIRFI